MNEYIKRICHSIPIVCSKMQLVDVEDSIAIFIVMNKISQYCFLTKVKFLEKVKDFCPKM